VPEYFLQHIKREEWGSRVGSKEVGGFFFDGGSKRTQKKKRKA
jgi:hypothetical protein